MTEETKTVVLTQVEGERLELEHSGAVALHGRCDADPLRHDIGAVVTHATAPSRPFVHMVCWDEDDVCRVEMSGRVTLAGDDTAPVRVAVAHRFEGDHHQTLKIEPVDHTLHLPTALARPIHHALQMRTPLQVRFCNSWHVASDYTVEVSLGGRRLWSIRLTGATVGTPQPCKDEGCPPHEGGDS